MIVFEMRRGVDDQPGEGAPSETTQPWDRVRRVREPVAWTLLVVTVIGVLIGVWELVGLTGTPGIPGPGALVVIAGSGPVPTGTLGFRASVVAPQFVAVGIIALPVLSVILVAFAGGLTDRASQVVRSAVSIQAVALAFGVISWLSAFGGHLEPGVWFISYAAHLAVAAAALIVTAAVMRSQALRSPTPQFQDFGAEDDGTFGEDDGKLGGRYEEFGDDDEVDFGEEDARR